VGGYREFMKIDDSLFRGRSDRRNDAGRLGS
jgi:hypothetical protein